MLAAALVVALACPAAVGAAQINITTQADELATSGSGSGCSLRETVQSANTDSTVDGCTRAGQAMSREVIGRSVQGRPLVATRIGDPEGERVALVVGVIHGDERAGLRVVSQLKRRWSGVKGLQLWMLKTLNPDGQRTRSRKNARGVDLNRNFPADWRGGVPESSGYYPGPSPASEPETKAAMAFIKRIQPDVSVWYHQPWGAVLACKGRPAIAARYAKLAGMRTSCRGRGLPGTAIGWQREKLEGSDAFVVEFGPGGLSDRAARRHARAAAIIGRDG